MIISRVVRAASVCTLVGVVSGCFSMGSSPAAVVVPKDPTSLAKCSVSKSQASPLVTEWPASEKAHLESLLSDQAVVVSYSGCEMRILDGCRPQGSYRFKRTTLANDVIEIRGEDELYAKIPLGAASLEGELASSGRLAVRTTVVGQMRLDGDLDSLPESKACERATHVISALSVGAFELISGGAVSGKIGVDVASAGAGVGHKSEESSLRSAGDPKACKNAPEDAPSGDCASPIQVFLLPVDSAVAGGAPEPSVKDRTAAAKQQREQKEPPADKSVEVHFEPPDDSGRWMLLKRSGSVMCELPCVRRVEANAGLVVQLDADRKEDIVVVEVPGDLGYSPGRRVKAVPQEARGSAMATVLFYGGLLAAGFGTYALLGSSESGCTASTPGTWCYVGAAAAGAGTLATVGGGIWFLSYNREQGLDMTLISDDSAATQGSGVGLGLTGLNGRF